MMPSAIDRTKHVLPVFSRGRWAREGIFPGDVLCIADPTLELDERLCIGWCIGDERNDAIPQLAEFVSSFARAGSIPSERIVIYGSSAGGFAALALAAQIEGSTAVAVNAQSDAMNYEITRHVANFRAAAFGNASPDAIRAAFRLRVDMSARWQTVTRSRAILVQNELDVHHYRDHFLPFWTSIGGDPVPPLGLSQAGPHAAWIYRDERGHVPESVEMARQIMAMLSQPEGFSRLPQSS
ncbi:hypothetical protein DRW48_14510 [Paracoccus suum]|uniref:Alpha/beta hydrolase n=2 Tax=Paracoccus suum TaxID=2259340 RepID=A0A344PMX4_9RHOB|nr:hypothetical protein DRW48_14510 [Paracoccus suum]